MTTFAFVGFACSWGVVSGCGSTLSEEVASYVSVSSSKSFDLGLGVLGSPSADIRTSYITGGSMYIDIWW